MVEIEIGIISSVYKPYAMFNRYLSNIIFHYDGKEVLNIGRGWIEFYNFLEV